MILIISSQSKTVYLHGKDAYLNGLQRIAKSLELMRILLARSKVIKYFKRQNWFVQIKFSVDISMSEDEANKLMRFALEQITYEDVTHRGFLKPIEVALKTYQTQTQAEEREKRLEPDQLLGQERHQKLKLNPGSLPAGLKIAVKTSIEGQKRTLRNIEEISTEAKMMDIRENNQDNMLALMKKETGIKLAICVCMYSETKSMLKSTLAGIAQNIANLVAYENMDPDDIVVVVMMDGIQMVNSSILEFYEELQKSSNINLGDNITPSLPIEQIRQRMIDKTQEQINNEEMKNVNNFLFDPAELDERNNLRFTSIRNEYSKMKKFQQEVKESYKKKRLAFQDLTSGLQDFFMKEARKKKFNQLRRQNSVNTSENDALLTEKVSNMRNDDLIEEYALDINRARPLIARAQKAAQEQCNSFFSTTDQLAHLSCFRKKQHYDTKVISQSQQHSNNRYGLPRNSDQLLREEVEADNTFTYMNLFLCVKYKNAGKLSSHNWFFNGFCRELKPGHAILLDVGLRPESQALLKMYKYMTMNQNKNRIGGVCGYMSLKMEQLEENDELKDQETDFLTSVMHRFVDIQRTQQVEYHFAHMMDKPFEASFGFIHVLPGAFSGYNMKALIDYQSNNDDELLKNYFKSIREKLEDRKVKTSAIGTSNVILRTLLPDMINSFCIKVDPESDEAMLYDENVYLAEDRILCMGIYKRGFEMAFLPDAFAEVDPMKTVHGLLGQRKRWINGSYFAFQKVKKELSEGSACNPCLQFQIFYLSFMNALSYFAPAFFMFTLHIAMQAFRLQVLDIYLGNTVSVQVLNFFVYTMDFIYALLVMTIVFLSLHFKSTSKYFKPTVYIVSTIFGLFMFIVIVILSVDVVRGLINNQTSYLDNNTAKDSNSNLQDTFYISLLRYFLIGSIGLYFVPLIFYWFYYCRAQPLFQVLLGYVSFLFYTPTYLNILNIYSLCKIDDISWGTKGLDSSSTSSALADSWRLIKFVHVAKYVIWNIVLSAVLLTLGSSYAPRFWVTFGMVCLIGLSLGVKVLIGILYMCKYRCFGPSKGDHPNIENKSRIKGIIEHYEADIRQEVRQILLNIKEQYIKHTGSGSFIQASRTPSNIIKSLLNYSRIQNKKSSINRRGSPPVKNKKTEGRGGVALFPIYENGTEQPFESNNELHKNDLYQKNSKPLDKDKYRNKK